MRRPAPAMVIATVALFVALGGTAVAARSLITSRDIKNGTIRLVDIAPATKKALRGQIGPQGPAGPTGAQGAQGRVGPTGPAGAPGAFAPSKISYVVAPTLIGPRGGTATASCPAGAKVVGGGYTSTPSPGATIASSRATSDGSGWAVTATNSGGPFSFSAVAVCAAP